MKNKRQRLFYKKIAVAVAVLSALLGIKFTYVEFQPGKMSEVPVETVLDAGKIPTIKLADAITTDSLNSN
ncbi:MULTISPECIES: hypothetical protein [Vibrio]|uniref:Uncharacterized protein n=2 Tax=Vibrio TaxID=662 RepID=A0A7X4LKK4_9VIBR|nr:MULTISPECIES: hypothetical protein [Vibrio]MBF9000357.1 hypothetical protein [Vibrio nitrifigilis]MZI93632.1 hypothetical protein [Vibrio eleionomae]